MYRKILLFSTISLLSAADVGPQVAGYRRDGTGVYPDCAPPTTGLKQQWVTELPSWGHSSPIAIGDKVFITVEPLEGKRDFPALICLDGASGKILWDKALNHLSAVPSGKAAGDAWKDVMADFAKRQAFCQEYGKTKDTKAMEAAGYEWNARWGKVIAKDEKPIEAKVKIAKNAGFTLETWRHGCSGGNTNCVGTAYATPVSDGKRIWTTTAWGGFFCHDLDGKELWVAFSPGEAGEYCRNGHSPILWKNLLLSDITALARAFDADTGKLLWSHPSNGDTIVSPMVLTVGGKDILWSAGCKAFLLPEGTPLTVEGWKDQGMQTLVKHDERDVVFFCGSGEHSGWTNKGKADVQPPAAVRFSLNGTTLKGTVLWNGKTLGDGNDTMGGNKPWMTYFDKNFYHIGGAILDAATGTLKTGKIDRRSKSGGAVPSTDHLLLVANGFLYGLTRGGDLSVGTVAGKAVSTLKIVEPDETYEFGRWKRPGVICGSDGPAFTLGKDRIYVRSNNHLHGIGQ